MKKYLFTSGLVIAGLTLMTQGAFAATQSSVTFNLSAVYKSLTCKGDLGVTGDATGTGSGTIDFGTFSSYSPEVTKNVTLTLDCTQSERPSTVQVSFAPLAGTSINQNEHPDWLYPVAPSGQTQTNLYYEWSWGKDINNTVKQFASGSNTGLSPGPVDLLGTSAGPYEVVTGPNMTAELVFPIDITRRVANSSALEAGYYSALVTVTVAYQ
ncbi:hypothetical protein RJV04_005063 [Salmonella enterica]|nr:hypothetical protein [Salmonella enterica]